MNRGPMMKDRIEVHRSVERLRASGTWPDELDFQDDAIGALQALSDEIAFDTMQEEQRKLLVSELTRELRKHHCEVESIDHSPDALVQMILHPEQIEKLRPFDPSNELAGRQGISQLHFRQFDCRSKRIPRKTQGSLPIKYQWPLQAMLNDSELGVG